MEENLINTSLSEDESEVSVTEDNPILENTESLEISKNNTRSDSKNEDRENLIDHVNEAITNRQNDEILESLENKNEKSSNDNLNDIDYNYDYYDKTSTAETDEKAILLNTFETPKNESEKAFFQKNNEDAETIEVLKNTTTLTNAEDLNSLIDKNEEPTTTENNEIITSLKTNQFSISSDIVGEDSVSSKTEPKANAKNVNTTKKTNKTLLRNIPSKNVINFQNTPIFAEQETNEASKTQDEIDFTEFSTLQPENSTASESTDTTNTAAAAIWPYALLGSILFMIIFIGFIYILGKKCRKSSRKRRGIGQPNRISLITPKSNSWIESYQEPQKFENIPSQKQKGIKPAQPKSKEEMPLISFSHEPKKFKDTDSGEKKIQYLPQRSKDSDYFDYKTLSNMAPIPYIDANSNENLYNQSPENAVGVRNFLENVKNSEENKSQEETFPPEEKTNNSNDKTSAAPLARPESIGGLQQVTARVHNLEELRKAPEKTLKENFTSKNIDKKATEDEKVQTIPSHEGNKKGKGKQNKKELINSEIKKEPKENSKLRNGDNEIDMKTYYLTRQASKAPRLPPKKK